MKQLIVLILLMTRTISIGADIVVRDVHDDIAYENLLPIFTKKKIFWDNGEPIKVFIKPINSIEHTMFVSEWLGISNYRYKKLLRKEVYSGKTSDVTEIESDEEMIIAILSTPYSIGYMYNGDMIYSYIQDAMILIRVIYND